ncbi:MAG TPA: xanthine dehydrogenase family protein subunit M [Terriglobia bacterium]|jgi:xanthine dehydrogenase YagS FAD-binding subunit
MNPFEYERVSTADDAVQSVVRPNHTRFLAGGTNLVDLMKGSVETPTRLVDINRLPLNAIEALPDGGLRLGAVARNSDTAAHPLVRSNYPLLSQAILSGASPQLRNQATNAGNLLQRTRCYYFMDTGSPECNKRAPGSGCGAIDGFNRIHAIFGASKSCIATHPSDMCVALAALDATIRVRSAHGQRWIPMGRFHRLPGDSPWLDTVLQPDELILSIDLPPSPYAAHSHYLKVRDRASYAFALISVAAALELEGNRIRSARIALGGVAHKPWRARSAEQSLAGATASLAVFESAARRAVQGAKPYTFNKFKVDMTREAIVRALHIAGGLA